MAEADLGERIMRALILRRVSLLQGGVGGPILIGAPASSDVIRLQGFLTRNGYPHHLLDPASDKDAADVIMRYTPSPQEMPLVVTPDGTVFRNPSIADIARAMGMLRALAKNMVYDVAIVGSGPAGLSTAVYAASEGLSVAVCDTARIRRPGRRQRPDRELSGFSNRHIRPGTYRARLQSGAEFGADIMIPVTVTSPRLRPL